MGVSYNKLFELMNKKEISKYYLRQNGFNPKVVNSLVHNNNVNVSTIIQLCKLLNCQPGDIMEYIPDEEDTTTNNPQSAK